MWWLSVIGSASPASGAGGTGYTVSVVGEVMALSATPFLMAGAAGMSVAAARDPAAYARSPFQELAWTGVGLIGVGIPLTIAGAEVEAAAMRQAGTPTPSRKDVAAWATYGAATLTLVAALPVADALVEDNPIAAPIVVGSAGVVSSTLWLCSVGLGSSYRGSLRGSAVTVVPTGNGATLLARF